MLILTRKPMQKIMVGHDVVVEILGVSGNHVRIGISAPKDMRIDREEIYERRLAEQRAAL